MYSTFVTTTTTIQYLRFITYEVRDRLDVSDLPLTGDREIVHKRHLVRIKTQKIQAKAKKNTK